MASVIWGKRPGVVPGRRHHPVISLPPASDLTQAPAPSTVSDLDEAQRRLSAEAKALGLSLVHRGTDEILSLFDYTEIIVAAAPVTIFTYQIPPSMVAKIDKIAVFIDNPAAWFPLSGIGWRILVNGHLIPHITSAIAGSAGFWPVPVGDMIAPLGIEPIWLQAAEIITVELGSAAAFRELLAAGAYLGGRLYKPASVNLGAI